MIYFYLGKDLNIINEKIDKLISDLKIDNIIKYDMSEASLSDVITEVNYVDLFNEKKLIIVSSFSLKKLDSKEEEMLSDYILHMNDNVIIFRVIDESVDSRKKIVKLIKEKCEYNEVVPLDYRGLLDYLTNMFKDAKLSIKENQIKYIMDLCSRNNDISINECKKLIIYKSGEQIVTDNDIDKVICVNHEKDMFNFCDSVLEKNIVSSLKYLDILMSSKIESPIIIASLAKKFRLLYQTKVLLKSMGYEKVAFELSEHKYTIEKLVPYTSRYKDDELFNILLKLGELDEKTKTTFVNSKDLIECFILSL